MLLLRLKKDDMATLLELLENGYNIETEKVTGKHHASKNGVNLYELSQKLFNYLLEKKVIEL